MRHFLAIFLTVVMPWSLPQAQETALEQTSALILQFVLEQTRNQPNQIEATVGKFSLQRLPDCEKFQAFAPIGTRFSGTTHIGLRCLSPRPGSILVPVQIAVTGNYVTAARALSAGQTLQASDIAIRRGDLGAMPANIVTTPEQAIGKSIRNAVSIGQVLKADQLMAALVIRQGQTVRIVSRGEGFAISSEGTALASASAGEPARARMNNNQIVSGIAQADGSIEIRF